MPKNNYMALDIAISLILQCESTLLLSILKYIFSSPLYLLYQIADPNKP